MKEIKVQASIDNLDAVNEMIDGVLDENGCNMKIKMQIDISVEELFVNIASYAYGDGMGEATVSIDVLDDPRRAVISFMDSGEPFDPLAKPDPDITLGVEERKIGGLGIYMVKKSMDDVKYEYKDGLNILKIVKNF